MKRAAILAALWLATLACATPGRAADDAYAWSLRYMLVNGRDDTTLYPATHEVASLARLRTAGMHELLAEILADMRNHGIPAQESALNIARILAAAPDAGRYHTLFTSLRKSLTAKDHTPLMTSYFRAHPKAAGDQFTAGRIDLAGLRRQYIDASLAAWPTAAQLRALEKLSAEATMDDLFAEVGTPAHVLPRDTRAARKYANVDVRQIVFYYRGVGRVTYELVDDAWRRQVVDIDPLAFEALMPYRQEPATTNMPDDAQLAMHQLLSGRPYAIRISAMSTYRLDTAPREYLDTAAELLLRTHAQATDEMTIDAYSWLCNVLRQHGDGRYARVLARVADETSIGKLERYARPRGLKADTKQPAYVPGSTSLEAQRSRYPPIYNPGP
jgi:hypothetical protein